MAKWPDLPDLAGVVALLYRADWTRLSLAGKVSGLDEAVVTTQLARSRNTARPVTLHVAPGRRYRRDDGDLVVGCDGKRVWQWLNDPPPDGESGWESASIPAFRALLCPSWLLTGYDLEVLGPWMACGRPGIRVAGTDRHPRTRRLDPSAILDGEWASGAPRHGRVEVVVDAELGILLRCKRSGDAGDHAPWRARVLEFLHLEVGAVVGEALFEPPPGSRVSKARGTGRLPVTNFFGIPETALSGLPWEAVKTAAGLTAGGLGAAIRYTPLSWIFRYEEGADEPMPDDDPPSGTDVDKAPVSDELLYLLYRSGGGVPKFTATAHLWVNGGAMLAWVPESARKTGLGGVGYLIDALSRDSRNGHTVSKVQMDGWQRYQIEPTWSPGSAKGKRTGPPLTACDGERYWEVHEDRVAVGKPRPAPAELACLTDASWLLRCELSGGEPITFAGRAAFRLSVRGGFAQSELLWPGFPAVAVVDAETGRLIRLTCYGGQKPAYRHELRDVTPASRDAGDDIVYAVPPGLRVVDADSVPDPPDPPRIAARAAAAAADELRRKAGEKLAAAKGFLGSPGKRL